jgi:hypothetical protein
VFSSRGTSGASLASSAAGGSERYKKKGEKNNKKNALDQTKRQTSKAKQDHTIHIKGEINERTTTKKKKRTAKADAADERGSRIVEPLQHPRNRGTVHPRLLIFFQAKKK